MRHRPFYHVKSAAIADEPRVTLPQELHACMDG